MSADFFITLAVGIVLSVPSFYFVVRWKRSEIAAAERLAGELGLHFELRAGGVLRGLEKLPPFIQPLIDLFSPWRISGSCSGFSAWIYPELRSSGKSSKTYLIVKIDYPTPLPFDFRAGRETVFTKMGKSLFNLPDVEVGDWVFDDAVRIKASDSAAVAALFADHTLQDAFLSLLDAFPEASADREAARWERPSVRSLFRRVPAALGSLAAFVAALEKARA
jgi:hypothetical protein